MAFPLNRPRRLRRTEVLRRMVRETRLSPDNLIQPIFVCPGRGVFNPINAMPGVAQLSPDMALREAREIAGAGVPAVILFGLPQHKDAIGSEAWSDNGSVQTAIREIKEHVPDLAVITDVCMCEYTDHGHCGAVKDGDVDNDATLELLRREALSHARAGADIVAPSDMMDGRVGAIRAVLDENGFARVPIMAYSAKYASAFYGPFREAAESAPAFGDRRSYQMDPANGREALRESAHDEAEGADILMVKPGLAYLDVLARLRERTQLPLAVYQVSGEYSMIRFAAQAGAIDERTIVRETLGAFKRAGADLILSYFARDVIRDGF